MIYSAIKDKEMQLSMKIPMTIKFRSCVYYAEIEISKNSYEYYHNEIAQNQELTKCVCQFILYLYALILKIFCLIENSNLGLSWI